MAVVGACICISLVMSFALTSGSSDDVSNKEQSSYTPTPKLPDGKKLEEQCGNDPFTVCCKLSIKDIEIPKRHFSHDGCCCDENGDNCTSYDRAQQICNRTSGELKLLPRLKRQCEAFLFSPPQQVCCKNPITSFLIPKTHPSHDDCCCNGEGPDCSSFARAEHVCDHQSGKLSVRKTRTCRNPPSSRYSCCSDDSVYLPGVMSCDQSTGEITLKQDSSFQSSKLCRNKLHPGFDDGPAPTLRNKGLYVEGRVEKVRVDIGANYIIIDLLPVRLNSTHESRTCLDQSQGRLRVMVQLPPKQWCKPLDEVQEYLYGKTLDIWADFMSVRYCRSKLPALVVPSESKNHWVMVSRRPFYLKL